MGWTIAASFMKTRRSAICPWIVRPTEDIQNEKVQRQNGYTFSQIVACYRVAAHALRSFKAPPDMIGVAELR